MPDVLDQQIKVFAFLGSIAPVSTRMTNAWRLPHNWVTQACVHMNLKPEELRALIPRGALCWAWDDPLRPSRNDNALLSSGILLVQMAERLNKETP